MCWPKTQSSQPVILADPHPFRGVTLPRALTRSFVRGSVFGDHAALSYGLGLARVGYLVMSELYDFSTFAVHPSLGQKLCEEGRFKRDFRGRDLFD